MNIKTFYIEVKGF